MPRETIAMTYVLLLPSAIRQSREEPAHIAGDRITTGPCVVRLTTMSFEQVRD